ncbi:MAG: nicotinate phosphoribosyltransferase [Clostridioides sp.]|jgi:nicotinate phosphoribosyltransferase|nr:nicotinate phosphoribosyltransferase [Clostridioides sp.]
MKATFTDCYEFTMGNVEFLEGRQNEISYFDLFFRKIPQKAGYAIFAGLEKVIEDIKNIKFEEEELKFLKEELGCCDKYIDALRNFKLECDISSVVEGTPIFPNEPIMTVRGPKWQADIIEVKLLNSVNYQSLVATKASRIRHSAKDKNLLEFGARRAQGDSAALWGSRAAYIGGFNGVSVVEAGVKWGIPVSGTMAHSFVQKYDSDYEAFKAYAKAFPDNAVFLVDTFDVLESGIPASIRVHKEILEPMGKRLKAIRLDSGDLAYLSKRVRKLFDLAGMQDVKIIASNSLNEYKIFDLLADQNAPIDTFGVGENLITGGNEPVFGCVYKLVAIEKDSKIEPRIKISENVDKITIPGAKKTFRLIDNNTNKSIADVILLENEETPSAPYELFDPKDITKRKVVSNFTAVPLLTPIFKKGELVYELPSAKESKNYCIEQLDTLWEEMKRFHYPHKYYVDMSMELWELKNKMIKERRGVLK